MRAGPVIRRMFGPYEHRVAEIYRRVFIDLDDLAEVMRAWVPDAKKILEVGCGEGAMTERLVRTYPAATITCIDISPNVGRLFRSATSNVTFRQETAEAVASREPGSFDLVILSDVIHHVPMSARKLLISAIRQTMGPNSSFIFKDWATSACPIHYLCAGVERYITGDEVSYLTTDGIRTLLVEIFGEEAICRIKTVRPWKNNIALLVRN